GRGWLTGRIVARSPWERTNAVISRLDLSGLASCSFVSCSILGLSDYLNAVPRETNGLGATSTRPCRRVLTCQEEYLYTSLPFMSSVIPGADVARKCGEFVRGPLVLDTQAIENRCLQVKDRTVLLVTARYSLVI